MAAELFGQRTCPGGVAASDHRRFEPRPTSSAGTDERRGCGDRANISLFAGYSIASLVFAAGVLGAPEAWAGSPRFVSNTVEATRTGNTLVVSGKEAGLGDESEVNILVTATAECINNGGHHPKAENKESLSAEGQFPVQNGKALFEVTLTASFQPECAPPMTVVFSNVVVTDLTNEISKNPGQLLARP
jgi:hypothetical protein